MHRIVPVPVPEGAEVTSIHWHLTPASFAAVCDDYGLVSSRLATDAGDSFLVAHLTIEGQPPITVYGNGTRTVGSVSVEAMDR
jgi:hypothetical protein